jgi:hypothetical protein
VSYCRSESRKIQILIIPVWDGSPLLPSLRARSISKSDELASALKVRSIRQRFAPFWSTWAGDLAAIKHEHLDCCRRDRHALRIPMMAISRSEVMAIIAERSDARLFQCESVIGIRQGF